MGYVVRPLNRKILMKYRVFLTSIILFLVLGIRAEAVGVNKGGKLFGPFDYVPDGSQAYTLARLSGISQLHEAKAHNVKVLYAPSWWSRVRDANGCLDVEVWKSDFDADAPGMRPYVDDGTVIGLYALDEPHDQDCLPTKAQLTELCDYSRARFPDLPCGYNAPPAWMEGVDVDYLFQQTNFTKTLDWSKWAEQQFRAASWFDGPIYLSINAYTGNPTDQQIIDAAIALCSTDAAGVMMWKWQYVSERDLSEAIEYCANAGSVSTEAQTPTPIPECVWVVWNKIQSCRFR